MPIDRSPATDAAIDAGAAPNVHLRQLAYLRAVAQAGSFTAAATALGISQPALSQALAELQRRLGRELFERAGRGRRLTADGEAALASAQRILAEAEALARELAARARGEGGTLRVGMIDAASLYVLPDVIGAYRQAHPSVDLRVRVATSDALIAQLRAFELDLVFAVGPPDDDLRGVEVLREPLHVYAPPSAHAAAPPADAEWALYPLGSRTRGIVDAGLARLGIVPRVTLESGNPEVLRQLVALGLGWSVLPRAVAEGGGGVLRGRRGARVGERRLFAMQRGSAAADARTDAFVGAALARGSEASRRAD